MTFMERMKGALDKSVEASKDFFDRAGDTAKDLSSKGVLKLEIRELEGRAKKEMTKLGHAVYQQIAVEGKASVTAKNQEVAPILEEIRHIESEIVKRESQLDESTK